MNNKDFLVKGVRVHYPSFFEPRTFQKEDGSVETQSAGAKFLFDPKDLEHKASLQAIKAAVHGICQANNPKKDEATGAGRILPPDQWCLRDGSLTERDELQGLWFVSANSPKGTLPFVLDPFDPTKRITDATQQAKPIYNGCKVNVRFQLWWQSTSPGRQARVNAKLIAVQFAGDGEPIGGGIQTTEQAAQGFDVAIDPTAGGHWGDEPASATAVTDDEF